MYYIDILINITTNGLTLTSLGKTNSNFDLLFENFYMLAPSTGWETHFNQSSLVFFPLHNSSPFAHHCLKIHQFCSPRKTIMQVPSRVRTANVYTVLIFSFKDEPISFWQSKPIRKQFNLLFDFCTRVWLKVLRPLKIVFQKMKMKKKKKNTKN